MDIGTVVVLKGCPDQPLTVVAYHEEESGREEPDCYVDVAWISDGSPLAARYPVDALVSTEDSERNEDNANRVKELEQAVSGASRAAFEARNALADAKHNLSKLRLEVDQALQAARVAWPEFDPHDGVLVAVKGLVDRALTLQREGNEVIEGLKRRLSDAGVM